MPNPRGKSDAYIEALLREAVAHVELCIRTPLADFGYDGPQSDLRLSDGQHDFLAGYIYGALQRLLELGEIDSEADLERAANRLYGRLFGPFDLQCRSWHMWVVHEGLHQMQRPHVFLGYCAGRGDIVDRMRRQNFRPVLGSALSNLSPGDLGQGGADL